MFANDCTMFSTILCSVDNEAAIIRMQDLDNIQAGDVQQRVKTTPHECQAVTISKMRNFSYYPLTLNGNTITEFLTVDTSGLSLSRHI